MTHTLAGLEKRGLVEMRPNPEDGRSKRVWLTPAGRTFRDRTIRQMGPVFDSCTLKSRPKRSRPGCANVSGPNLHRRVAQPACG